MADPVVPASQSLPRQERGQRPSRALPYRLAMMEKVGEAVELTFANNGTAGACFHVVAAGALQPGPWTYTVEAGKSLTGSLPLVAEYDLTVFGPNGFFRQMKGAGASALRVEAKGDAGVLLLTLINEGDSAIEIDVTDAYGGGKSRIIVPAKGRHEEKRAVEAHGHWYELTIARADQPGWLRRLAGHVETGKASVSDPMIA